MTVTLAYSLSSLDGLGKIAVFLIMLSVLVVLHEAGHFLFARLHGVRVNDFAVGFGPTLLKWTSPRSGTNYRVNLLPIGGYCAMQGEDGKTSEAEQQRDFRDHQAPPDALPSAGASGAVAVLERPQTASTVSPVRQDDNFQSKPAWQRLSIIVAGPIANFVLAYVILLFAAVAFGIASDNASPQIGMLLPNSPAVRAGLHMGDAIVAIDGVAYTTGEGVIKKIHGSANKPLRITYRRHGSDATVTVTPYKAQNGHGSEGRIGFTPMPTFQRVGILHAIPIAATEVYNGAAMQVAGYAELLSHPRQHFSSLSGVIGMGRVASAEQDLGWAPYLQFAAVISIALGILNLLPFPALDGGRAVFIVAEMLRGRSVEPEKEALVHVTGFAVLMVLMVFVAYRDIANIVSGKGIF